MALVELPMHLLTSILLGYLALTNTLAGGIESLVGIDRPEAAIVFETEEIHAESAPGELPKVVSNYEFGGAIPDILLENAAYQKAAVIEGAQEEHESSYASVEESLVNVFCQYRTDEYIRTTTGTGFFIHENGVVLTNAHVAQFLLLEEADAGIRETECVLRTGDPAMPRYTAELLYISPAWIHKNAELISKEKPTGTGERDYALLYVSGSTQDAELPDAFPALRVDTELLSRAMEGAEVITAGYPAETLLQTDGAEAAMRPVIAETVVGELYTFGSNYADIFSISGSSVGEQGSSGGPVLKDTGGVIGLIVTKGNDSVEGEKSLRALALPYIDRTIREETGYSLIENAQGDLAYRGSVFKKVLAPFLRRLLAAEIEGTED